MIYQRFQYIASDAFGRWVTLKSTKEHFESDFAHLLYKGPDLVGWATYKIVNFEGANFYPPKTIYLKGIVLRSDLQRLQFQERSLRSARDYSGAAVITMKTQNPIVYHITRKSTSKVYPCLEESGEEAERLEAKRICEWVAEHEGLNVKDKLREDFVARAAYGHSLYGKIPECKDKYTNEPFGERLHLNYEAGDLIVVVGYF